MAVDFYLLTSVGRDKPPNEPYSGKLMLHLPFEVRVRAAIMVIAHDKSLNQQVIGVQANARWLIEAIMPSIELKRHYFQGILKRLLLDMAVYLLRLDLIDAEVKFGNRSPIIPQWQ